MQDWLVLFLSQIKETGLLEWLAVLFGVSEVLLARKNNILLYPTGIISILLSSYLLFHAKLYAETLLNAYYLIMSIYGWYFWIHKKSRPDVKISWTTKKEMITAICISVFGFFILHFFLVKYTTSDVPWEDAIVASTAWAGMWLLAKRKIENWIFLNISNIIAIPLLIHKHLPMMAMLTLFLFVVAIFGYLDWKKIYKEELNMIKK
ncbi:nicotinamide mononucleotide transporter PnuC [Pseudopedobacter saltans DSM 12145]|uniref:Nicotinamide riboside transporter PnuC n=1 Tax=Pseudopedobacter saltans (strain ATCC 51119 / DSM 12145 / JCM 21818 / CCUG 39354 / LMG 10337 / NBRC 100064 / NCIMB 13643) TaxID=762903 RepID=F0S5T1_PSESL|nr:nicotinamide riboside transporter PnuC [Pseudopedobacter saltans]ADY51002.1 nicotinamide mononucleotide transporter PnuC [Pseudopedobacter saltans DSM 12145]